VFRRRPRHARERSAVLLDAVHSPSGLSPRPVLGGPSKPPPPRAWPHSCEVQCHEPLSLFALPTAPGLLPIPAPAKTRVFADGARARACRMHLPGRRLLGDLPNSPASFAPIILAIRGRLPLASSIRKISYLPVDLARVISRDVPDRSGGEAGKTGAEAVWNC